MTHSPLSNNRVRLLFAGFWILLVMLQAYALQGFGWRIAITDSSISCLLLSAICLLIINNLQYYRPEKERYVYLFVWCLLLSGIWMGTTYWILSSLFPDQKEYNAFMQSALPIGFGLAFLTTSWVVMASILWYTRQDQQAQAQRQADAQKLAREAELYKLRQQLQPHFLFNSLNSISALVGTRPEEARRMIHQLSDFLRGTLKKEEEQWVTLAEELAHLQLYLEIEKVRFGHRLTTQVHCDKEAVAALLPSMLLQPIVENAIKFGLYDTLDAVTITIESRLEKGILSVTVQNPFDPLTTRPQPGTGFGLSGVQRRLFLLFARHDLLETHADDQLFTTRLKIPQRK